MINSEIIQFVFKVHWFNLEHQRTLGCGKLFAIKVAIPHTFESIVINIVLSNSQIHISLNYI